ncbi:kinase-like domain-containing protein [Dichotomocladium elegans]|nr:kinase-like domain-containing protein [Dichotomocladium elegans]
MLCDPAASELLARDFDFREKSVYRRSMMVAAVKEKKGGAVAERNLFVFLFLVVKSFYCAQTHTYAQTMPPSLQHPASLSPAPHRRFGARTSAALGIAKSPIFSPGKRRRKDIGDYWIGKTLGKGSSGRVKLGIHKITGEKVAIKIIARAQLASNTSIERAVKREIAIMKLIRHPNIVGLVDVIDLDDSPNLYLVLEYVQGGELFEHLVSKGRLSEDEARKYFQQIIFGLDYCHRHLICHRDLKPENLLLDTNMDLKIADFGLASLQPDGSLLETSCGSPHYASPEIVNGVPYNGAAADIWSCGIVLYALLCGHLPFDDGNIRELLIKVRAGKYNLPNFLSSNARDLLQKILVVHPEQRYTMSQIQQHPWFTEVPPPNPCVLPDPPTAAEIGRPVSCREEIDERLLESLKVLWTDNTTEQVIHALLNDEHNMQKVTYVLLQRHANRYWQEHRDDNDRLLSPHYRYRSQQPRKRPVTICVDAASDRLMHDLDRMLRIADGTTSTKDPSPPVPSKPAIIHTPSSPFQRRQPHWPYSPPPVYNQYQQEQRIPWWQQNASIGSPSLDPHSPMLAAQSYRQDSHPQQPQHQFHHISHMLSPRTPTHQSVFHPLYNVQQQPGLPSPSSPPLASLDQQYASVPKNESCGRAPHPLWHRPNRIDPETQHQHPFKALGNQQQYLPFVFHDTSSIPESSTARRVTQPPPSALQPQPQPQPQPQSQRTGSSTPRLASWLPGLFHFKQPKVCSIDCLARDEQDAVAKVARVVERCMRGTIIERMDSQGRIRRKGEMVLTTHDTTKPIFLRFKVDVRQISRLGVFRVSFIQQQGDGVALTIAAQMVSKELETYEQESILLAGTSAGFISPQQQQQQQQPFRF